VKIVDVYHDPGHARLRDLLETHPKAYEYVKTADLSASSGEIPDVAFAWEAERRFPVRNAKEAALSWLYAKDEPSIPVEVKNAIKEAVEVYRVPQGIFEQPTVKQASAEDCLFPETLTYPVRNATEVKYAEARLLTQVKNMTPVTMARVFGKVYEKCAEYGVKPDPRTVQYCGKTVTDTRALVENLRARAAATKTASISDAFEKLATGVTRDPKALKSRAVQLKMADAIRELDEKANLVEYYHRHLQDPLSSVFNTQKVAADGGVDMGDINVSASQLEALPSTFFSDALGADILPEISDEDGNINGQQALTVIQTLPADMKRNFRTALKSAGM